MKIVLRLFSVFRDVMGFREKTIDIPPGTTLEALLRELMAQYPRLKPHEASVLLAVNRDFASIKTRLEEGDEVALMPPIGGG